MPWLLREPGPTVFVCASLGRSWPLLRPQMDSRNAETSYNRIAFILAQIARPSRATARARDHRSRPAGRAGKIRWDDLICCRSCIECRNSCAASKTLRTKPSLTIIADKYSIFAKNGGVRGVPGPGKAGLEGPVLPPALPAGDPRIGHRLADRDSLQPPEARQCQCASKVAEKEARHTGGHHQGRGRPPEHQVRRSRSAACKQSAMCTSLYTIRATF